MSENTTMNRPVMPIDIANKLGMSVHTVHHYLNPSCKRISKGVQAVRKMAEEMGYDPKAAMAYGGSHSPKSGINFSEVPPTIDGRVTQQKLAKIAKTNVVTVCRALSGGKSKFYEDIRKLAAMYGYENSHDPAVKAKREAEKAEQKANAYYWNSPFRTAEERKEYMLYLRSQGYGNFEIARKAGTVPVTVRRWIGNEPVELAKHNRSLAGKIRGQKNAARKLYLRNQKVADFNAKAEQHNAIKAEAERLMAQAKQMEAVLKPEQQKIAAMAVPAMPPINLAALQPTALQ